MARRTRNLVPKTTGAGVSRYSYQHAYALGQKGTGGGPLKNPPANKMSQRKLAPVKVPAFGMNISYGNTWGDGTGDGTF